MSAAAILTFVVEKNARPYPWSIPGLVLVLAIFGAVWWFTRKDAKAAETSTEASEGSAASAASHSGTGHIVQSSHVVTHHHHGEGATTTDDPVGQHLSRGYILDECEGTSDGDMFIWLFEAKGLIHEHAVGYYEAWNKAVWGGNQSISGQFAIGLKELALICRKLGAP